MSNWQRVATKLSLLCVVGHLALSTALLYANNHGSAPQEAEFFSWSEDPRWLNLLMWNGSESLWDSSSFFLSPDGKEDPLRELLATYQAMLEPQDKKQPSQHAQCRFPARRAFLQKQLHATKRTPLPDVSCPDLETWLKQHEYEAVSLVFSSSYVNNPASAFGHTLLRMHRKNTAGDGLLDDAVNFAGNTDTDNPFIYGWKGLTGGFKGQFAMVPYYQKIQEYAHAERRDLFEYELNLSQEEIDHMRLILWEWGPHTMDYYYFDDNCSGILLRLLAATKPELDFTPHRPWIIPSVTIRTVATNKDFIKSIHSRPSSLSQFLSRYEKLTSEEKRIFAATMSQKNLQPLQEAKDDRARAKILDTTVDYIDFVKRITAFRQAGDLAALRFEALKARAKLSVPAPSPAHADETSQPHRGHAPERAGVLVAYAEKEAQLWFEWRPAYHDLVSPSEGYGAGLEIEFFRTRLGIAPRRAFLQQFTFLRIANTSHLPWIVRGPDWGLDLGYKRSANCTKNCGETSVTGAMGTHVGSERFYLSPQLVGTVGYFQQGFVDAGVRITALLAPTPTLRLKTAWQGMQRHTLKKQKQWHHSATAVMALSLKPDLEVHLEGTKDTAASSGAFGFFWYF